MRGECNFHCVKGLKRKREFSLKKRKEKEEGTKCGGWSFSFETINFIFYFFTRSIWLFLF